MKDPSDVLLVCVFLSLTYLQLWINIWRVIKCVF